MRPAPFGPPVFHKIVTLPLGSNQRALLTGPRLRLDNITMPSKKLFFLFLLAGVFCCGCASAFASSAVAAWGYNSHGELGNGTEAGSTVPVLTDTSGVLSGKTVTAVSAGVFGSLALCSDGTLASWGWNGWGELGTGSLADFQADTPVLVDQTGVLKGKTVTAIACAAEFDLALCSDGSIAAWGYNEYGLLGNGTTTYSDVPVLVDQTGVLKGKTVKAISATDNHTLALCSDGTVASWGYNYTGQLGNGSTATYSDVPVLVDQTGVLSGKTVTAISAGDAFSLVLCSDGTLAAWGDNEYGQVGNGTTSDSNVPVLVDRTGVLSGKTISAISAGFGCSMVLCSDGTLADWGENDYGDLGNGANVDSSTPVLVDQSGVLSGKTVTAISNTLVLCSDGTLADWGYNDQGELGNGATTGSNVPVLVDQTGVLGGKTVTAISASNLHTLVLCSGGNDAPVNVGVTPGDGSSKASTPVSFSAVYSDADGAADITTARFMMSAGLSGGHSLYGYYDRRAGKLYLFNDGGNAILGGFSPGSANTITNSQGSLNCAATTVSTSGNNLTINWNFTPASGYTGAKNLYLVAADTANANSGWQSLGAWTLNPPNSAPTVVSVSPGSGSSIAGTARALTAIYSDADGAADITSARLMVSGALSGGHSLYGYYDRKANTLYLFNDAGNGIIGGFAPGSANVITNSQGSLNCATTTVSSSGNQLTVNWDFTPAVGYTGNKNLYLAATDTAGANSGWRSLGTWAITAPSAQTAATKRPSASPS
jgi:alpha-tubulin suppressor-like RCC1 family protein